MTEIFVNHSSLWQEHRIKYKTQVSHYEFEQICKAVVSSIESVAKDVYKASVVKNIENYVYHEAQDSAFDTGFNEAKRQAIAVARNMGNTQVKPGQSEFSQSSLEATFPTTTESLNE